MTIDNVIWVNQLIIYCQKLKTICRNCCIVQPTVQSAVVRNKIGDDCERIKKIIKQNAMILTFNL